MKPYALLALLICSIAGCGGAKKAAPPPAVQNANPAVPAAPVGGQAAANAALANANQGQNAGGNSAGAADPAETEPPGPDDFVLSTDQIVTEIENPPPPPPPAPFEVSPIANGIDSSVLVLVADAENGSSTVSAQFSGNSRNPEAGPSTPAVVPNTNSSAVRGANASQTSTAGDGEFTLPKGFTEVPGSPIDPETNLPLRIRGERDSVDMVLIKPGVFLRGADVDDPAVSPRHTVLMEQLYYIDTVEVSVGRYNAFREYFRKNEGRKLEPSLNHDSNPELPAVGIKFFDAKFYARWTSKELPTETQWERAARGDRGFEFPWGEGRPVFHQPRTFGQLDPVGTFPGDQGPFGVFDMSGNAREWCLDLYQADIYQKDMAAGAGTVRDPVGPRSPPGIKQQVVRGSSTDWAVWHRSAMPPADTAPDIGFRCVLNFPPDKSKTDKSDKPEKKSDEKKKNAPKF